MQKLLKKSGLTKQKKLGATSFIHSRGENITNEMWQDACKATVDKYHTVLPVHRSPSPASPAFLKNYDEIDWHRKEESEIVETK